MKPHRFRLTHALLSSYGIFRKLDVFRPHRADFQELTQFHSSDYIEFLKRVSPDNAKDHLHQLQRYNLGPYTDCPVFEGLYDYCQLYAGGSIDGAARLNHGLCDVAINWHGGLHHAKKTEASGFCYVNDIVLGILELLKYHARVLYIDIDIHHGDGVEEAFYTTDRVMTLSFHKYGDFFPGTGSVEDRGADKGRNYSINVPLNDGTDDRTFLGLFKPILQKCIDVYRPGAIVLQCGADSLTGDRLGVFNITTRGHGEAVRFTKQFGLPTLVVGGGGYNIRNVSRCWAYETCVLADTPVSNTIPYNDFFHYYAPEFRLHLTPTDAPNLNTRDDVERLRLSALQTLSSLEHAPGVQMHRVPPDMFVADAGEEEDDDAVGGGIHRKEADGEYFDGEADQDASRYAVKSAHVAGGEARARRAEENAQGIDHVEDTTRDYIDSVQF
jgi:histone deacetylase 1/2